MTDIQLLVSDIDGTLVTSEKQLTQRAQDAAHELRERGIELSLTSSRPPRGMKMLVGPLAITTPVAAFNGGMIVEPDLQTILEQRPLSLAVAEEVLELIERAGLAAWVYRGKDWFVRDDSGPRVGHEIMTLQFAPTVVADLGAVLDQAIKIVGVSDDYDLVARVEGDMRERVGHTASVARSQAYYVDVTHPDANKGRAVRDLAARLSVPLEHIAVIGDMPTDVLMFGQAGVSIAMGNATWDVQRCARYVTSSNDDDGFANAVERYILGGSWAARSTLGLPSRVEACLFDLDGVLTQTAVIHAEAWRQTFDDYLHTRSEAFVAFDAIGEYAQYVDGKPRSDGVRSFLAARGIHESAETVERLAAHKDEAFMRLLRERTLTAFAGSVRYVHAVRESGLRAAVVSSSKHTRDVLQAAGITDLFEAVIDGNVAEQQHLAGKPAPDTYLAAARALAVEPSRAAVFEDALAGVEAGHAGHFGYVVGVDRLGHGDELRRHGADVVVQDLANLLEAA